MLGRTSLFPNSSCFPLHYRRPLDRPDPLLDEAETSLQPTCTAIFSPTAGHHLTALAFGPRHTYHNREDVY